MYIKILLRWQKKETKNLYPNYQKIIDKQNYSTYYFQNMPCTMLKCFHSVGKRLLKQIKKLHEMSLFWPYARDLKLSRSNWPLPNYLFDSQAESRNLLPDPKKFQHYVFPIKLYVLFTSEMVCWLLSAENRLHVTNIFVT